MTFAAMRDVLTKITPGILLLAFLVDARGHVAHANQNVVVVLDDSGSMDSSMRSRRGQKKIEAAKSALQVVLGQLQPDAKVGILLLNGSLHGSPWIVPMGPVDIQAARAALQRVRADGLTPLGEKMKQGADALLQQRSRRFYGDYRLLVVTDGEATDGSLVARYLPEILARGLTVDVIGVDMSSDHSLATQVHSYRRADDPESLERAIRAVFAETSATDDDGQTDFEFIEGFPSDVAAAALAALADAGNEPIGATMGADPQAAETSRDRPGSNAPSAPSAPFAHTSPPAAQAEKQVGSWVVYLVLLMIILLAASAKKKRRH